MCDIFCFAMNKKNCFCCFLFLFSVSFCFSQKLYFKKTEPENPEFETRILKLNKELLKVYREKDSLKYNDTYLRLQILDKDYNGALRTLNKIRNFYKNSYPDYSRIIGIQFELFALMKQAKTDNIRTTYERLLREKYSTLPLSSKNLIPDSFKFKEGYNKNEISRIVKDSIVQDSISLKNAILLCRHYNYHVMTTETFPIVIPLLKKLDGEEFLVKDSVIVKTKRGHEISLYYVVNKKIHQPQPTILTFTIYNKSENDILDSKLSADKGYNVVQAYSCGVYLSKNEIAPFEYEAEDVNEVIDWIIKQPWSNGKVGMEGGSYNGFSQWAAAKNLHPALKTIIPSASVGFGIDFPMENNVFNTYMIRWTEYVTKSRFTSYDDSDSEKWKNLVNNLYEKGEKFKRLDSLNGNTNPVFQKWVAHPSFDMFWQSKIPYKKDFSKINIPVLTFTGYFDDDQPGAMYYYNEHHKYNKKANHYLVIGPYDHYGSQGNIKDKVRGYKIDEAAKIDMEEISYQWFDYILKGKAKPGFLKDKINYQVMGSNQWKSASAIDQISNNKLKLFLNKTKLQAVKPGSDFTAQKIDLADRRDTLQNFERYKIQDTLIGNRILKEKLIFESEIFDKAFEINGNFTGKIKLSVNKKDLDISIKLYELMANGKYLLLSTYLGRASYLKNREKRQLLVPGKIEKLPIQNTYFASKKIEKGSKLLVVLGVNKDPFYQINYGTGKDVSEETIADAKEALEVKWYNDSYLEIPVVQN